MSQAIHQYINKENGMRSHIAILMVFKTSYVVNLLTWVSAQANCIENALLTFVYQFCFTIYIISPLSSHISIHACMVQPVINSLFALAIYSGPSGPSIGMQLSLEACVHHSVHLYQNSNKLQYLLCDVTHGTRDQNRFCPHRKLLFTTWNTMKDTWISATF